jgi:hypothetical protein
MALAMELLLLLLLLLNIHFTEASGLEQRPHSRFQPHRQHGSDSSSASFQHARDDSSLTIAR